VRWQQTVRLVQVVISSVQTDPIIIDMDTTLAVINKKGVAKKAVSFVFVKQLGATVVVRPNFRRKRALSEFNSE
jgi:hypothetical protein